MLKIKLVRKGKRNLPSFRVEVTAGKKTVESIGSYYPHSTRSHFIVSKEKLEQWLKAGAQITPAVSSLLKGKYEFKKYVPKKSGADSQELAVGKQEPGVAAPVTGGPKPAAEETPPSAPGVQEPEHPEASVSKIDSPANPKGLTGSENSKSSKPEGFDEKLPEATSGDKETEPASKEEEKPNA